MAKLFALFLLVLLLGIVKSEDGNTGAIFQRTPRKLMQSDEEVDQALSRKLKPFECATDICNLKEDPVCVLPCTCDSNLACTPGDHPPQL